MVSSFILGIAVPEVKLIEIVELLVSAVSQLLKNTKKDIEKIVRDTIRNNLLFTIIIPLDYLKQSINDTKIIP